MDNPVDQENEGGEKLIGGKFKSQDELFAAYEEATKRLNDTKEALDRETRLNELLSDAKPEPVRNNTGTPKGSYVPLSQVFDENTAGILESWVGNVVSSVKQETLQAVNTVLQDQARLQYAREKFYTSYPELKGHEDIVDQMSGQLISEIGNDKIAKVPYDKLASEVASRTKKYLSDLKQRLTKSPLHLESGSGAEVRSQNRQEVLVPKSEEERAQEYFKSEVKDHNKRLQAR